MTQPTRGNLGAARARRRSEAATRLGEARGDTLPLYFDPDRIFAVLQPEFPAAALAPLLELDQEIAYTIRQVVTLAVERVNAGDDDTKKEKKDQTGELIGSIIELLMMRPNLPIDLIRIARQIGTGILGEDGMAGLEAEKPSLQDYIEVVKTIWWWHGEALGKSLSFSKPSSTGGTTSTPTSSITTSFPSPTSSTAAPAPAVGDPQAAAQAPTLTVGPAGTWTAGSPPVGGLPASLGSVIPPAAALGQEPFEPPPAPTAAAAYGY
ncbi:hypothetical protein GCM10022221_68710 [Actinocorallia aurea]